MMEYISATLPVVASFGSSLLVWAFNLFVLVLLVAAVARFLKRQQPREGETMWGLVVVAEGERWKVTYADATVDTVAGPRVLRVWGATFRPLLRFTAADAEYITLKHVDGKTEVIPGPASAHQDKSIHKEIKVHKAINLSEHEVLVVYRSDDAKGSGKEQREAKVERFLVHGPCLYVPKNCTEWTHDFSWHGSSPGDNEVARKRRNALNFQKLRTCPDQTYYDVEVVRTKDDALVSVKLMIFFRLKDINVMLRETHDPMADFINAITSDVIDFVAARTFEQFKQSSEQLNDLGVYRQLTSRAAGIGFEITKVVFRGYGAPQRLQKMHDDAIEQRTKLALQRETEEQEQQLQDMRLTREEVRKRRQWQLESDEKAHEVEMEEAAHQAELARTREDREAQIKHLLRLKNDLGIPEDQLAAYLLAVEQGPPGKLIQIVGQKTGSGCPSGSFIQVQDAS